MFIPYLCITPYLYIYNNPFQMQFDEQTRDGMKECGQHRANVQVMISNSILRKWVVLNGLFPRSTRSVLQFIGHWPLSLVVAEKKSYTVKNKKHSSTRYVYSISAAPNLMTASLSIPSLFVEWLTSPHFTASRTVASALALTIAQESDPNGILMGSSFTGTWDSSIKAAAAFSGSPMDVTFARNARHLLVGVSWAEYAGGEG